MKGRTSTVCKLFLLGLSLTLLGGCSKKQAAQTATPTEQTAVAETASAPAVCSLLTPADVEAVMGKTGTTNAYKPDTECILSGEGMNVITVTVMTYGGEWAAVKQAMKSTDPASKDISGLGEDAFTFMGGVVTKKGQRYVSAGGTLSDTPMKTEQAAKYLAEKVVAKL